MLPCNTGGSVELGAYFPYLKPEERRNPYYLQQLKEETENLQQSFGTLVLKLKKDIEKICKCDDVITLLSFSSKYPNFEKLLEDCCDLADVFKRISKYCSFFDYGVIKHLGKNFGSPAFKKEMKVYKCKFRDYAKRRVCQCPLNAFGEVESSEKVYSIKIEEDIRETFTLQDLQKLEYEMNKILGHKLLRLLSIEEGCMELTFRVFPVDDFTITAEQRESLRQLKVLNISYQGETFKISTAEAGIPAENASSEKIPGKNTKRAGFYLLRQGEAPS